MCNVEIDLLNLKANILRYVNFTFTFFLADVLGVVSSSKSECPLDNGTFRDRKRCSSYFTCAADKVVARYECPEGLNFNDVIEPTNIFLICVTHVFLSSILEFVTFLIE